jgi:hypothetical protein
LRNAHDWLKRSFAIIKKSQINPANARCLIALPALALHRFHELQVGETARDLAYEL